MHRTPLLCLVWIFFLVSCTASPAVITASPAYTKTTAPVENTATLQPSPTPAPTLAPTNTLVPKAAVTGRAVLSSFPEMTGCSDQKPVPAGTEVTLGGTYQDYALVSFERNGVQENGYLPKDVLSAIPAGLPELNLDQVAWKPVADYRNWSYYSPEDGGSIVASPTREDETDWVTDPAHHPIHPPLKIHFGLKNTSTRWGGVKLTGTPDSDPWWKGITRMDIANSGGAYSLCIRDGSSENCTASVALTIPADQEITLVFADANGKQMQVLDGSGKLAQKIDLTALPGLHLPGGLFPSGWFQFGTTIGPPGTLKVTHFSMTTPPSGVYQKTWLADPGLADLAAPHGILIGTEFGPDEMMDDRYCTVVSHDFNLAYLSAFTNGSLWLGPEEYNFQELDRVVNETAKRGMTIYASHLVWGAYEEGVLPAWLKNGKFSKQELLTILENHIKTLVGRYKDRVSIWSIANEAPERDIYRGADFWYDTIGPEYIEKSFQWAREADPKAILIFNAANNESPRDADTTGNINRLYTMVKTMKGKGVPIDRVGLQMHFFLPWSSPVIPKKEDVVATMRKFGDLGVKVMITEMDVDLHEISGTAEEKVKIQTQLYSDMMAACVESGACVAFSTWGVGDSVSWITCDYSWCVYKKAMPDAAPLMFDVDFNPKPAYFAVRDVLLK
jgi:endo-1,4-beta-xylanase